MQLRKGMLVKFDPNGAGQMIGILGKQVKDTEGNDTAPDDLWVVLAAKENAFVKMYHLFDDEFEVI